MLVGNKVDLVAETKVCPEQMERYAIRIKTQLVSSKEDMFSNISIKLDEKRALPNKKTDSNEPKELRRTSESVSGERGTKCC